MPMRRARVAGALLPLLCALVVAPGEGRGAAPARRAVIVGIDAYVPADLSPGAARLSDLQGAVTDALAMYQLLRANYGFADEDIELLLAPATGGADLPGGFGAPTREAILTALDRHLAPASPGDVAFFYFAGHGSQVANLSSDEADGLDETLVPADSAAGAPDIRDKELRRIWNRLLDAGADLTVVIDACHSGSVARGYAEHRAGARFVPPSRLIIDDPPPYGPIPSRRSPGALIISAALESQTAIDGGLGFTGAFLRALRAAPDAPVAAVVRRATAILQADSGSLQQPLLEGGDDHRAFLGSSATDAAGLQVIVSGAPAGGDTVQLDAGRAFGLREGAELTCAGGVPIAVLQVGPVRSTARALGPRSPQPGDVCRVVRWTLPALAGLPVWYETAPPDDAALAAAVGTLSGLLRDHPDWFLQPQDPTRATPTHILHWRDGLWWLGAAELGPIPDGARLGAILEHGDRAAVFVDVPPSLALGSALAGARAFDDGAVLRVPQPESAVYRLVGRLTADGIEYAWVVANAVEATWESTLPIRSDWVAADGRLPVSCRSAGGSQAACLGELAAGAALLRSWLLLDSPPAGSPLAAGVEATVTSERRVRGFAYELALRDAATGEIVEPLDACRDEACERPAGTLVQGRAYTLVLRHVQPAAIRSNRQSERRYVYAFAVDRDGCGSLLYPIEPAHTDAHVQQPCRLGDCPGADRFREPDVIELWPHPEQIVAEPFGVESLFLLAVDTALSVPPESVFELPCLRSDAARQQLPPASDDPLANLLRSVGRRRGDVAAGVGSWTVQLSRYRTAPAPSVPR